ncbi:MFS transporter [Paracoccus sulfuroxidans]|uniref:DHA2 family multidrug resistance protein-like MFS transporter n=1 Tax=Paracoccus sulfuroxidans TaxID=384678 RepID=A0A562NUX2_9RHOB|nr:MFS transporter [Paracoccus sulfuroxidans]TWI36027.1 DHA2 family multidrug resistance protein-like MFS transporter [Paracoccus sulfuroxidans]
MPARNRWLALAVISSALFLIVIDMTVLYTALPRLTHDLGATANQKLWIVNAYPLVVAGLLPGLGTLGDRFGHRRMFMLGLAVFGVASTMAAFAWSPQVLIGARVALAVGAAMMMPATLSLIRLTFTDEDERAFAIGIWAAVASGGAAIGPVIGGILLEYFWWGSVFLINVPVVLVALVLVPLLLPYREGVKDRPWDLIGSLQVMVGLVGLVYAIKEIAKRDPAWGEAALVFAIGLIAMVLFVRRQLASAHPLIDFSLFAIPRFTAGVIAALVAAGTLIGFELVFTQRMQLVVGHSPLYAGLLNLPLPLAAFFAGPIAGLMLSRLGTERMIWLTLLGAGLGLAGYLLSYQAAAAIWLGALAVMGFAIGACMTAASSAIMLSAPEDRAGMAASVEEVSYELGGALGVAILGSLFSALYTFFLHVPDSVPPSATARDSLDEAMIHAETLPADQAAELLQYARAAFDHAFVWVTFAAIVMLLAASLTVWKRSGKAVATLNSASSQQPGM